MAEITDMRRRKRKNKTKENKLILLIKINSLILAWLLLIYLLVGLMVNPGFFKQDLKNKYAWAVGAANVVSLSVKVPAPDKPKVAATPRCDGKNSKVNLNWLADDKAEFYDIYRDESLIFSDLNGISYDDEYMPDDTEYSYQIDAKNYARSSKSDIVNVRSSTCGGVLNILGIKNKPTINLGGSIKIQWNDVMRVLSSLIIILLGILILFLSLLLIEYLLAKRRLYLIDETNLKNQNLIS